MSQETAKTPLPNFNFEVPRALEEWHVPAQTWLTIHDKHFSGLASAALIFSPTNNVLLLQRAPHDSIPLRWEPPGGAVDPADPSILHGCAREAFEEAGLIITRFVRYLPSGSYPFTNRTGTKAYWRFSFEVEVENEQEVRCDPDEHVDWSWVTREEVENEKREDGKEMPITTVNVKKLLLEGFDMRAKIGCKVSESEEA